MKTPSFHHIVLAEALSWRSWDEHPLGSYRCKLGFRWVKLISFHSKELILRFHPNFWFYCEKRIRRSTCGRELCRRVFQRCYKISIILQECFRSLRSLKVFWYYFCRAKALSISSVLVNWSISRCYWMQDWVSHRTPTSSKSHPFCQSMEFDKISLPLSILEQPFQSFAPMLW